MAFGMMGSFIVCSSLFLANNATISFTFAQLDDGTGAPSPFSMTVEPTIARAHKEPGARPVTLSETNTCRPTPIATMAKIFIELDAQREALKARICAPADHSSIRSLVHSILLLLA